MNRRKPLTHKTPMKRSRIKRRAPKYPSSALLREREAWAAKFKACWICRMLDYYLVFTLDTHEICRRSQAPKSWAHPCNYFRTCRSCHEQLGDYEKFPLARQLAIKLLKDPEHYDLEAWRKLTGRGGVVVSEADVMKAVREELLKPERAA